MLNVLKGLKIATVTSLSSAKRSLCSLFDVVDMYETKSKLFNLQLYETVRYIYNLYVIIYLYVCIIYLYVII